MSKSPGRIPVLFPTLIVCTSLPAASTLAAAESPFAGHPAAAQLARVFAARASAQQFEPSGLTRRDYLKLIAGNIDYWTKHQDASGAIIDPYQKGERQYTTPAFALAGALLVTEAGRDDLLDPVSRAMSWASSSLAAGNAADAHGDFFMPMLIHTRRLLKDRVSSDTLARWDESLKSIVPEKIYNMKLKGMNWNLVSSCGELLRRQDGLVVSEQREVQRAYLEDRLSDHAQKYFTDLGMYADPGVPLTYDLFARLWLDDMMAGGAYDGPLASRLRDSLRKGGLSTLLLLSPSGEWPSGGRSSHHNWTEAEAITVCEIHAALWKKAAQPEIAGAFKRAAHLAYQSMLRWQRPEGELWIIKNRCEPDKRFAFERYSNHSQYNTLPMAMLALAYLHADDSISERPAPGEVGGYVFDLREKFHKVIAAAGGYYVEIDTAADPHYNATGLQRVHRVGVSFPPLSDSTVAHRDYGANDGPGETMSPGIQWKVAGSIAEPWESLGIAKLAADEKPVDTQTQPGAVRSVELNVQQTLPGETVFTLRWTIVATGTERVVTERYTVGSTGLECVSAVEGKPAPLMTRVLMPALIFDGKEKTKIDIDGKRATILHRGSLLTWRIDGDSSGLKLDGPQAPAHNGMMQALVADLANAAPQVRWRITLEQQQ